MTTVSGNNVIITATDIVGSTQGLIIRNPTINSSDTIDTASAIILAYYGTNTSDYDGDSFTMRIYNDTSFIITLGPGTGITMFPTNPDTILPQASHTYFLVKTSGTTMNCYMISNANASNTTGISLASGNIVVGSTNGIGSEVPMTGDATMASTGELTLVNTGVIPGFYTQPDITVDSKGRITSISGGSSDVKTFFTSGPTAPINMTTNTSYTNLTSYSSPVFDIDTYSYSSGIITILSSGTYQIAYTMQFNSNGNSGTTTGTFQTRLTKNGTGIAPSVTQSSLQRIAGTNNTCNNSKVYQLVCSINDTIALQYAQLNTTTAAQLTQIQTTLSIEKFGTVIVKNFNMYGPIIPIGISTTTPYTNLTSYSTPIFDPDTYSYSSGTITILTSGTYQIAYTMQFNSNGNSGSATGSFQTRLTKNGTGIAPSVTQSSLQRLAGTNNTCNNSKVYQLVCSVNDTIVLQYAQLNTSTIAQLTQDQTVISIERLK